MRRIAHLAAQYLGRRDDDTYGFIGLFPYSWYDDKEVTTVFDSHETNAYGDFIYRRRKNELKTLGFQDTLSFFNVYRLFFVAGLFRFILFH